MNDSESERAAALKGHRLNSQRLKILMTTYKSV